MPPRARPGHPGSLRASPLSVLACGLSLCAPAAFAAPTDSQDDITLLKPRAVSYATTGGYELSMTRDWTSLSFDLFTPRAASARSARFGELKLSYAGTTGTQGVALLSYGQVWRRALSGDRVFGVNAYLDFGKLPDIAPAVAQMTFGMEYELAHPGGFRNENLVFGSNIYLPFLNYTAARFDTDAAVPRRGLDSYVRWSHAVDDDFDLAARLSVFHYAATPTRAARGIGTIALSGTYSGGLPPGTTLKSALSGRYTAGEDLVPTFSLSLNFARPTVAAQGTHSFGTLQPSAECHVNPGPGGSSRMTRLDCGESPYEAPDPFSRLTWETSAPEVLAAVPAPERYLGYATPLIP
ncbi:hypothetical protein KM176_13060 [Pseudooceanicola sp. CBS1P-1]|uniref:Porin n=1 Tax=Pseudooceanicola albus TaxID=2692189 RepID=A0A6L7G6B4_9RHOB|nr:MULTISPECIES: hypothetical protein [Pseudooceanicola]MBT9384792.1 hypothetical protein [Pseudooceanicola endophyticus]MXN18213.1 hypothetical protein [Pseudooceanicola albus]